MRDNIAAKAAVMVLLLFLIITLLCSCASDVESVDRDRFMLVREYLDCCVYVDLETGAEWIQRGASFAEALDTYGRPVIWRGFDAREDRYQP